jgi:hypothetical protein
MPQPTATYRTPLFEQKKIKLCGKLNFRKKKRKGYYGAGLKNATNFLVD